jgi:hypothetical protein
MAETLELLRQSAVFADLPDDQINWFLSQSREVQLKAGGVYARQGDPAEAMFVLLEGEFQWRGEFSGATDVCCDSPPRSFHSSYRKCLNWPRGSWD